MLFRCLAIALVGVFAYACSGGAAENEAPAGGSDGGVSEAPADAPDVEGWRTGWSKTTIDLSELIRGLNAADPRDEIPPLDEPKFETVAQASEWLEDREPVAMLELEGAARAYPLRILTWHEIVNDEIAGTPVAVTYSPLGNSAVGFDRRVEGQTLRFGVSGLLRNSDLVVWDRQTESLWQQITGEAIVGELAGTRLPLIPTPIVSWKDFRETFPNRDVLSRDTGENRAYGSNPYVGYDPESQPFLFNGELDSRYPPMERVVGVTVGAENKAYPFSVISEMKAINDGVGGEPLVVLWGAADTASALDSAAIGEGRAVGTGVVYLRTVDGRALTFEPAREDLFRDVETGSIWDLLGNANDGPLVGKKVEPAVHTNHLWFAGPPSTPGPLYSMGPRVTDAGEKPAAGPRQRILALAGLVIVVGVVVGGLALAGLLGNQVGGAGIGQVALLDTPPASTQAGLTTGPERGKLAPNFEISSFDATRHRLSDFRGKPVYVNFWATWCLPCQLEARRRPGGVDSQPPRAP